MCVTRCALARLLRSDRGLKFEKFVLGGHGGREIDEVGMGRHAKAKAKILAVRPAPTRHAHAALF